MFGLCGVELFGNPPTTEQATQQCERPAPKQGGRASSSVPERTTGVSAAGEKAQYDEDMQLLLRLGLLKPSQVLRFPQPRKRLTHKATVESDGTLRFQNTRYHSPTGAANAAAGTSNNGWLVWRLADGRNLDALRAKARREMKRK
ncbi:DUF4357 domain-containing protein [Rhodococcus pyridinivorans]|uniref:restriction system modified-DNA reader domain-containing protein n=1 Tax=Rhodococcus TaxID=1827 RepID=UPI000903C161